MNEIAIGSAISMKRRSSGRPRLIIRFMAEATKKS